jgi:hypothetical protein
VFCVFLAACPNPSGGSAGNETADPLLPGGGWQRPLSSAREITAVTFASVTGIIDAAAHTVMVLVPRGPDLTSLTPAITVSPGARVTPASGTAQDFTTPVTYTVTAANGLTQTWTVTVLCTPFSISDIRTYLASSPSGTGAPTNPILLPVGVDLASEWSDILSAIVDANNGSDVYVALDLSASTACENADGIMEFDPGTDTTGVSKIVSLVLPDAAKSIKAGISSAAAISKNFTALTEVSGESVETIGNNVFADCTVLKTVDFPAATIIGSNTFSFCPALTTVDLPVATIIGIQTFGYTALETVTLPEAKTIGGDAFYACAALETVNLPKAETISWEAFWACAALKTVDLSAVKTIDDDAFNGCTALTTLNLPATPPTLKRAVFERTGSTGTLEIVVPTGAVSAYTSAWGVDAVTEAGNTSIYGMAHKAITITDTPAP